jgi:RHS repeat-associated protein
VQIAYLDNDTTRVTEADGGILEYSFNSKWLATDVRRVSATGASARSLGRREWDADGMLIADIDAQGNASRYTYDSAGNLATITDARRHVTRIEYDQHNQPIAVTDALGHISRRRFDAAGRIIESTDALGHKTSYIYDPQGRLTSLTDANGGTKQLSYDGAGRLIAYTDCSNFSSHYRFDAHGRLIGSTDAIGNTTHYHYDALGRVTSVTHPDQSTETSQFDADGNLTSHTDPKAQVTRYRYNGHGLPIERIDPKGQSLEYRYDQALRLSELINGNHESYLFAYDAEGRLKSETGFDGKLTSYTYDTAGQLIASDSNDQHTDYLRDALGLLLAQSTAQGSVRYAYDALGRLTAIASSQAEQRYRYDPLGQLIEERSLYILSAPNPVLPSAIPPLSNAALSDSVFTLTHSYDPLGNRLQTTLPNGRTVDTQRYGSGHWHGTLWQGNAIIDLERDHLHRETLRQLGASNQASRLSATRSYDPQSRLSSIALKRGQQSLRERQYRYDSVGNLTEISDAQRGNTSYRYDPLGQLLSAVQPSLSEQFAFDPAGNLLDIPQRKRNNTGANNSNDDFNTRIEQITEQPAPGVSRKPPQLAKVTHNLLRSYLGNTYEYDVQGNTIVKRMCAIPSANQAATLALEYDAENRLICATKTWGKAKEIAHYRYDAFGRRIAKHVTQTTPNAGLSGQSNTTLFVWDGDILIQEIDSKKTITYLYEPDSFVPLALIESKDGLHSYSADATPLAHPTQWDLPLDKHDPAQHIKAFQDQQEQEHEQRYQQQWQQRKTQASVDAIDDGIYYYHCDHLGTPLELSDADGKIVWSARYQAWGRILRYEVKEITQPLRFQGQYEDEESGLYYNRHRYYDPDAARYVTQDPIGLLGGANSYQYAPNPVAWIDPLGLAKKKGGCDPCCGKNPAATARSWQGATPYDGVDSYSNMVVKKGTVLYTLYPHGNAPGNYLVKGSTVISSTSARNYNDALQVAHKDNWDSPNARDMRTKVHAYVLNKDTCMAVGSTEKNSHLGSGGGVQYFIENSDKGNLIDTGKIISFKR